MVCRPLTYKKINFRNGLQQYISLRLFKFVVTADSYERLNLLIMIKLLILRLHSDPSPHTVSRLCRRLVFSPTA